MPAWPEAVAVTRALERLWRGRLASALVNGLAVGLRAVAAIALAMWMVGVPLPAVVIAVVLAASAATLLGIAFARRTQFAAEVERRAPACQNLVVTATELIGHAAEVDAAIGGLVCAHAARRLERLDARVVFPIARPLARHLIVAIGCVAVVGATREWPRASTPGRATRGGSGLTIGHVTIAVQAPAYAALPARTLVDPDRVEALVGSRLHVVVESPAPAVTMETTGGRQALSGASGRFEGDVTLAEDGYLLLQAANGGATGPRKWIGLAADPDHPPIVAISKPGRDLFVPTAAPELAVEIAAEDDLGLASLRLAYTKVSGSGENFTFGQGDVPIAIAKADERHWHATVDWTLAGLALAPGDMVVYRAIAADRRPGAAPVESDAFIVQVLSPNQADVGGFSVDEDPNKYALSQRMVVLKTERLLARKPAMAAADFADEAMNIAAEERQVRAMFVFMLGGEFEDAAVGDTLNEVTEAESEGDIAAGRLRNQARVDLATATRFMSSASTSLAAPDVPTALTAEKSALDAIQRAFTKDRYLLRAMSSTERIDLSRRLGGTLSDLARQPRPVAAPEPPDTTAALRRLLARLTTAAGDTRPDTRAAALQAVADDCLRADPASTPLRDVAATIERAAREGVAGDGSHPTLDRASAALAAILRASSPETPGAASPDLHRLNGALADASRRGGSR